MTLKTIILENNFSGSDFDNLIKMANNGYTGETQEEKIDIASIGIAGPYKWSRLSKWSNSEELKRPLRYLLNQHSKNLVGKDLGFEYFIRPSNKFYLDISENQEELFELIEEPNKTQTFKLTRIVGTTPINFILNYDKDFIILEPATPREAMVNSFELNAEYRRIRSLIHQCS